MLKGLEIAVIVQPNMRDIAEKLGGEVGDVIRAVAREILYGVVDKTPWRTGTAKANWYVSFGGPGPEYSKYDVGSGTAASIAKGRFQRIRRDSVRAGDELSVYNNTPYIGELEEGSSQQAPNGMVALTMLEVELKLNSGSIRLTP